MSEPNSAPQLANVMQDPDSGNSQAQPQDGSQDTSTGQQASESQRVNGLMASLGRRTNERDAAVRERDAALAERDEAQRALDELVRQQTAQPSQQDILAADEAERTPAPPPERRATLDTEGDFRDEQGQVLMTEQQWQAASRLAPVTPSRPSQVRADSKKSDLDALNKAITTHLGVPR